MPTRRRNACRTQRNHVQTIYFRQKKTNEAQQIFDYITKRSYTTTTWSRGKPPQTISPRHRRLPSSECRWFPAIIIKASTLPSFKKNGPDFSEAARKNMQTIRKHYNYARTNGTTPTNCRQNNSPKQIILCTNRQSVTANKLVRGWSCNYPFCTMPNETCDYHQGFHFAKWAKNKSLRRYAKKQQKRYPQKR